MPLRKKYLWMTLGAISLCVLFDQWNRQTGSVHISKSKNLFKSPTPKEEIFHKLKTSLEINLSSNFGKIPANQVVEINASLNPGIDYQNVYLEWRLGPGVRLVDGALDEIIPYLNRGYFLTRKIHVLFLDQNENHQIHVVARFKENGKALGAVAQFNSRLDLIEASKYESPPQPAQTEATSQKGEKSLFKDESIDKVPSKPRILM